MSGVTIPLATSHAVLSIGLVVLAALIGVWLLASSERMRWGAAVLLLAFSPVVLAGSVVGDSTSSLPHVGAAAIGAAGIAGLAAVIAAAWVFTRWPRLVMPVALATIAFRVPIEIGGDSVKLLLPLYLTIAGAVLARAWSAYRGSETDAPRPPKLLDVTIVAYLGLYALQSAYSSDISVATQNFCFFYAPFVLLYGLAASQKWDAKLLRTCATTLVAVALVLVFAGYVEFARGKYLITVGGTGPSDFDPYFRVQSLFFDPNIYGRFLAVVMLVVASVMLYTEKPRRVLGAALVLALLWAGLVISLSQSSFAALLAGLVALACMRWRAKPVLIATAVVALIGAVAVLALPSSVTSIDLKGGKNAETTTSGRFDLVTGAKTLWRQRPVFGHGSGSFSRAYRANRLAKRTAYGPAVTTKSHTAPLTVAAEQGLVGLASFIALLFAGFGAVFRRVSPGDPPVRPGLVARVAVAAAFTAIFVHTLAYAAFLEDPLTWTLLGAAVSLAAIPRNGGANNNAAPGGSDEPEAEPA